MARGGLSSSSIGLIGLTGFLVAAGIGIALAPGNGADRPAAGLPVFDAQGHRGARGLFPENSLPAFQAALAIGVTTLEMDTGVTADGVVVVHHDPALDPERTRGPDGAWIAAPGAKLIALTHADLAGYDIGRPQEGSKVSQRFPKQTPLDGVRIPALASVLAMAEKTSGKTVRYNIETKVSPLAPEATPAPEAMAEALVATLRQSGAVGRATVQSFDWRSLQRVQEMAPEIPTVYLTAEQSWLNNLERGQPGISPWTAGIDVDDYDGSIPRAIQAAGGAVWSPFYRDLQPADLAEAQRLGLKVVVWTVNKEADMASLIDLGVDGIITDYPDILRKVMRDKGLALPPAFGEMPKSDN